MSLEATVYSTLNDADSHTSALVGAGAACRVYTGQAPDGAAMPYAVSTIVVAAEVMTHGRDADLEESTVQFSCVARNYKDARDLAAAIRADLKGANLGDSFILRAGYSDDLGVHVVNLDVTFWNVPAAPAA